MRFAIVERDDARYILVETKSGRNLSRYVVYHHEPLNWIMSAEIEFNHRGYKDSIFPYFKNPMEFLSFAIWCGKVQIKTQKLNSDIFEETITTYREYVKNGRIINPTSVYYR